MDFGFLSLLPPLVAIVLAVLTRKVVIPLVAGVVVGALVLSFGRGIDHRLRYEQRGGVWFVTQSPWFSGINKRLAFEQVDYGDARLPDIRVMHWSRR